MPLEIHREPLYKRYYAPVLSVTCLYITLFLFILIALPLIIAYNSYNFWWKEAYTLEQPQVQYQYVSIFQWSGYNSKTSQSVNYYYSTNAVMNQLFAENLRTPILRSAEIDTNRDGLNERLEISVQLPLQSTDRITSVTSLIYFDVSLNSVAKLLFDAVGYVNYESGSPIQQLNIDGDLMLRQTWPFQSYGGYRTLYSDNPLFPTLSYGISAQRVMIDNIMQLNNARNTTMVFRPNYQNVARRGLQESYLYPTHAYCNTSIIVRIPLQPILYTPPVSAVLKFAWIQYVSFFLVIAFLLYTLNSFIFTHKLLPVYSTADIVYEKIH